MDRPHYLQEVPRRTPRKSQPGATDSYPANAEGAQQSGLGEVQGPGESLPVDGKPDLGESQGHSEGAGVRQETSPDSVRRAPGKVVVTFDWEYPDISRLPADQVERFVRNPGKFAKDCIAEAQYHDVMVASVYALAHQRDTRLLVEDSGFYALLALLALRHCQVLKKQLIEITRLDITKPHLLVPKEEQP